MLRPRDERALSDIVGTMLLLGMSVLMIAGIMTVLADRISSQDVHEAQLDLSVQANAGASSIAVLHVGGDAVERSRTRVLVHVDETTAFEGALGAPGELFKAGDRVTVGPLLQPLPSGARVEVVLYPDQPYQYPIGEGGLRVAGGAPHGLGGTIDVDVMVDGRATGSVAPPTVVRFEARVVHSAGRKMITRVDIDLSPLDGPYNTQMHDDGTRGDVERGDGVFTLTWYVDPTIPRGYHDIRVSAEDASHNIVQAIGRVHVIPYGMSYNTSLIEAASIRVMKFEGGRFDEVDDDTADGEAKADLVTAHVKLKLVSDPAFINGEWYWLNHTYFRFDSADCPHQHGCEAKKSDADDSGIYEPNHDHKGFKVYGFHLGEDSPKKGSGWFCNDASTHVRAFKADNETIKHYDKDKTTLSYNIVLEWEARGGNGFYEELIDATTLDADFVLRRTESMDVITDGEWPTQFDDCTDQ